MSPGLQCISSNILVTYIYTSIFSSCKVNTIQKSKTYMVKPLGQIQFIKLDDCGFQGRLNIRVGNYVLLEIFSKFISNKCNNGLITRRPKQQLVQNEFAEKYPKTLFAYPTVNMPFFCLGSLLSGPDSDAHSDGLGSRYRH